MSRAHLYEAQKISYETVPECLALLEWLRAAKHGMYHVYYTGAGLDGSELTNQTNIWKLKQLTWKLAVDGRIYLVQRKLRIDRYEYRAIKASSPPPIKRLIPFDYAVKGENTKLYRGRRVEYGQSTF